LYYAWKLHSIPPSVFSNYGICEKIVLKNFIEQEIEEINRSNAGGNE